MRAARHIAKADTPPAQDKRGVVFLQRICGSSLTLAAQARERTWMKFKDRSY